MAQKRSEDEENLEALEFLSDSTLPTRPAKKPKSAQPAAPPDPPSPPPIPAPPPAAMEQPREPAVDQPRFCCLNCGYPLMEADELRCSECGQVFERDVLEYWYGDDEKRRFEHVTWMALAVLFLKLLVLPELLALGRFSAGVVIAVAGYLAARGKQNSTAGYFADGALIVGVLMALGFACMSVPLAYYTLDVVAGCLLLLGMLHDPVGGPIGSFTRGRRLAPIILFAAPLLAVGCYGLSHVVDLSSLGPGGSMPPWLEIYNPFRFLIPYLIAVGTWVFVWRTLVGVRRKLFGVGEPG